MGKWISSEDGSRGQFVTVRMFVGEANLKVLDTMAKTHEGWTRHDAVRSCFWEGLENVAEAQSDMAKTFNGQLEMDLNATEDEAVEKFVEATNESEKEMNGSRLRQLGRSTREACWTQVRTNGLRTFGRARKSRTNSAATN